MSRLDFINNNYDNNKKKQLPISFLDSFVPSKDPPIPSDPIISRQDEMIKSVLISSDGLLKISQVLVGPMQRNMNTTAQSYGYTRTILNVGEFAGEPLNRSEIEFSKDLPRVIELLAMNGLQYYFQTILDEAINHFVGIELQNVSNGVLYIRQNINILLGSNYQTCKPVLVFFETILQRSGEAN